MRALVCFPYAGAGASIFRSWVEPLAGVFQVLPVQLPGREERFAETPHTNAQEAVQSLLPQILLQLHDKSDIVLFGHSLGAALAFELALRLTKDQGLRVRHLVASGAHAPTRMRERRATGLSAEQFLAQVQTLAGYRPPALENPEMREVILPILRADVEMHERYRPPFVRRLEVPITCVRGNQDELVSPRDLSHWQELTKAPLQRHEVEGGHMYLLERQSALFSILAATVQGST
jgi:surfactin synthase thioesterase subunit